MKKWTSFNAGVILMDDEVHRLTHACVIYPMNGWIRTKTHICEGTQNTFLFLQQFAQILQLVMWIHTVLFAVGAHKLMSPFTRATSRTVTLKDKSLIEFCCFVSQLKATETKDLLVDRFGLTCTPLRHAGRGLWFRLKNTCQQFKFSLCLRFETRIKKSLP